MVWITFVFRIFLKSQWFFLNYLYYLELSLTGLCGSLINSFEVPKSEKKTKKNKKKTNKINNRSLKKHHRYIFGVYHWLDKIHVSRPPQPPQHPKVTADLKSYL